MTFAQPLNRAYYLTERIRVSPEQSLVSSGLFLEVLLLLTLAYLGQNQVFLWSQVWWALVDLPLTSLPSLELSLAFLEPTQV